MTAEEFRYNSSESSSTIDDARTSFFRKKEKAKMTMIQATDTIVEDDNDNNKSLDVGNDGVLADTAAAAARSSSSASGLRGDARRSVAEKWANHRRLRKQHEALQKGGGASSSNSNNDSIRVSSSPSLTNDGNSHHQQQEEKNEKKMELSSRFVGFPPLCVVLRRTWDETIRRFQPRAKPTQRDATLTSGTGARDASTTNKRIASSFPSVLKILQTRAIQEQVELFQNDDSVEKEKELIKEILLLQEDSNFDHAVYQMSQSRSRVFLLLDLAAIVATYITWKKQLPPNVQMVYSTKHNSNSKLVQVLYGLGINFQVSTKYEYQQILESIKIVNKATTTTTIHKTQQQKQCKIWDDPEHIAKPNSYYRTVILDNNNADPSSSDPPSSPPLAIDGPDEVFRLTKVLKQIARRRGQEQKQRLEFILRLEFPTLKTEEDDRDRAIRPNEDCIKLVQATVNAITQINDGSDENTLVGVALDLSKSGKDTILVLESLHQALQQLKNTSTSNSMILSVADLQLHLTTTAATMDPQLLDWLLTSREKQGGSYYWKHIFLDVSHLLVANAGALCTRIIGVKQNEPDKIHYYIDDGCYGSLSHMSSFESSNDDNNAIVPMPLLDYSNRKDNKGSIPTDSQQQDQLLATVWGPTCDGLDKVCSDLPLPKLCRDDWLVFSNLGFCNVGTNFNGFAPPDVAYCVLGGGYYLYQQTKPNENH